MQYQPPLHIVCSMTQIHNLTPLESLTIRLLVSRPRTRTTKLLRLTSPAICYQQCSVVLHERLLQLVLGELIDVFLVVCDDRLGDCLSDGVDLRSVTAAGDADADVDAGESLEADYEEGFVDLSFVSREDGLRGESVL
jgi:hypothetical protein